MGRGNSCGFYLTAAVLAGIGFLAFGLVFGGGDP